MRTRDKGPGTAARGMTLAGWMAAVICAFVFLPASRYAGQTGEPAAEDASTEEGNQSDRPVFPAYFDVRNEGKAPVIKSQGKLGTCWALTATSALEAAFLPEADPVFSADHMSMENGFVISQEEGGDYKMIMAYLSGWYGPVLESDDPYGDGKTEAGAATAAHVQQMRLLDQAGRDGFKRAIIEHGPVQSSLYMDRKMTAESLPYYNEETCAYYYPEKQKKTHDVLILGWDDHFSAANFATVPHEDGAWICQNTWGEDFGDGGIFYVSYADANLAASGISYEAVCTPGNYSRIYQTDVCGWQGRLGYGIDSCCFANVYTCEEDEVLEAVGFYSTGEKTAYEVYLIHDFEDSESFVHKRMAAEGELDGKGYFTVSLAHPEPLKQGERFAVAVNIETEGSTRPVAVELKKDKYTAGVTLEGKEGYISLAGGIWENAEEVHNTNICLKAYTSSGR